MEFLYLNEEDMINAGVMDMDKCLTTMEEMLCLLEIGDYRMSGKSNNDHGARVKFPDSSNIPGMPLAAPDRWFTAMPAYLGGRFHMFGIKSYGSNHENAKKELPRSILMMQLLDIDTGAPVAYMSANIMSAMRTGALAGIGAKYFAPKNVETLGVIGPGVMSRYALLAILNVCPQIKTIKVFGRGAKSLNRFVEWASEYSQVEMSIVSSIVDVCDNADVVFTGNTRGEKFEDNPFIGEEYLKKGSLVIVSSAVRFMEDFLNDRDKCICAVEYEKIYEPGFDVDVKTINEESKNQTTYSDYLHKMVISGEKLINLSSVISKNNYERDNNKIYVYGAFGMPVEDVAWGTECYLRAKKKGIGTKLKVWDEPSL